MKKTVAILMVIVVLSLLFTGCKEQKKCFTCGKKLEEKSFTAWGNDYCEQCFKYDWGIR